MFWPASVCTEPQSQEIKYNPDTRLTQPQFTSCVLYNNDTLKALKKSFNKDIFYQKVYNHIDIIWNIKRSILDFFNSEGKKEISEDKAESLKAIWVSVFHVWFQVV